MLAKTLAVLFVNCNKQEWRKQWGKRCRACKAFAIYLALQDLVSGIVVVLQHESSLASFLCRFNLSSRNQFMMPIVGSLGIFVDGNLGLRLNRSLHRGIEYGCCSIEQGGSFNNLYTIAKHALIWHSGSLTIERILGLLHHYRKDKVYARLVMRNLFSYGLCRLCSCWASYLHVGNKITCLHWR